MIPLFPRNSDYDVLANTRIDERGAKALSVAAEDLWNSLMKKDARAVGEAFTRSFEAQISMFPNMVNAEILEQIEHYKQAALGWKISGAGGGGYLILFSETPIDKAIQIRIRR